MTHRPSWFRNGYVFVSYAPTVGINKDGKELWVIDPVFGERTGVIDDKLEADVSALVELGETTSTSVWIDERGLGQRMMAVPSILRSAADIGIQ